MFYVWAVRVVYVPVYLEDYGWIQKQVSPQVDGKASKDEDRWYMGLPPTGQGDGGGRHIGGGDLHRSRQNMVAQGIATITIMDLYLVVE